MMALERTSFREWCQKHMASGLFLASIALYFIASQRAIANLIAKWHREEYSHAPIIVLLAFFIGWQQLVQKKPLPAPSFKGAGVLLVAAALLFIGRLSALHVPAQYGLIVFLVGLSLSFYGAQTARALIPAFVYLLFAIPLPSSFFWGLSQTFQLVSSTLGVLPLQLFGVSVFQEGNVIDLGTMKLQVVEACNGLRYLFPLMSFGFLIAYLMEDAWWKRGIIFISTMPITILMNAFRIAVIGFTVTIWGKAAAEGVLHDFEGWIVFLLCLALLAAEVRLLALIGKPGRFRDELFCLPKGPLFAEAPKLSGPGIASFILCVVLAATVGTGMIDARKEDPLPKSFSSLPLTIGNWNGTAESLDPVSLSKLNLTEYWLADYARPNEKSPVNLYVAYYAKQRAGAALHPPTNCISGNGYEIENSFDKIVDLGNGLKLPVSRVRVSKGDEARLVYYWFDQQGRKLTNHYLIGFYLLWSSLTEHRTDGLLVRLITPIGTGETESMADARIESFLKDTYNAGESSSALRNIFGEMERTDARP